jgi:hypothetical protein
LVHFRSFHKYKDKNKSDKQLFMIAVFDRQRKNLKAIFLSSCDIESRHILCACVQTEGYETQLGLPFLPFTLCFPVSSLPIQEGLI